MKSLQLLLYNLLQVLLNALGGVVHGRVHGVVERALLYFLFLLRQSMTKNGGLVKLVLFWRGALTLIRIKFVEHGIFLIES